MGRKILAVIMAMIAANAIIGIVWMISTLAPPFAPKNVEYMSWAEMGAYVSSMPPLSFVIILIGYMVAAFAGGFIVSKMGRRWSAGPTLALIVGVLLTLGCIVNFLIMLPGQPLWFVAASLICYIPFTLIGYRLAK